MKFKNLVEFCLRALLLEVTAVKNGYSLKIMLFSAIHISIKIMSANKNLAGLR